MKKTRKQFFLLPFPVVGCRIELFGMMQKMENIRLEVDFASGITKNIHNVQVHVTYQLGGRIYEISKFLTKLYKKKWRMGINNLPVRSALVKKGVNLDNVCPFCANGEESIKHIFFFLILVLL